MIPIHTEHPVRVLFKSNLLRIEDYRCLGSGTGKEYEEWPVRHEIVIPRSGLFVRHDAHGTFPADPNQVLFFNRGQPYQVSHPVSGGDRSTIFVLQQPLLIDLLRAWDPAVEERPDGPFTTSHAVIDPRLQIVQHWLLQVLARAAADPLAVEERGLSLLAGVARLGVAASRFESAYRPTAAAREHTGLAERVKEVLSERYTERLRLEEVSSAVYSSPYHLCRIFKKETGVSIHQYLQRLRLVHSLEHLAERPGQPLSWLALDLGFSSHNHFTTAFRNEFGLTPSEFRRGATGGKLRELSKILKA